MQSGHPFSRPYPDLPWWVPMTDRWTPNPGCISSLFGTGVQMPREEATQPRAGENSDMILRVGVGCCLWASSLLGTFRWCVATKYLTLKMSPGLEGVGCLQSLASSGLPLHLLGWFSRDSSLNLDPKQAEASGSTNLSALYLRDAPSTAPPPSLLSLLAALNAHHLSNLTDPKKNFLKK